MKGSFLKHLRKMNTKSGNLITLAEEREFDVIVHGCNCFHTMGGGIAAEIARRYPEAEDSDNQTPYGDSSKLGDFSYAVTNGGNGFVIVNAYTQFRWSGFTDVFEYEAFDTFLNRLFSFVLRMRDRLDRTVNIGFPKIGCGLARGDEKRIIEMLENFCDSIAPYASVTLVVR